MAFRLRSSGLHHSPQWYHEHCRAEDGGYPGFRAMLTADMKFVDADIDSKLCYQERIDTYEEAWNAILSGKDGNASAADLQEVMERENASGFTPKARFSDEPFLKIGRLMDKHDLTTAQVREFLAWRAKDQNIAKARLAKVVASLPAKKRRKRLTWAEAMAERKRVLDREMKRFTVEGFT